MQAEIDALLAEIAESHLAAARASAENGWKKPLVHHHLAAAESSYLLAIATWPKNDAAWEGLAAFLKLKREVPENKRWIRDPIGFAHASNSAKHSDAYPNTLMRDAEGYSVLTHAAHLFDEALVDLLFEKATGVSLKAAMSNSIPDASKARCIEALQDVFYGMYRAGDRARADAYLTRTVQLAGMHSVYAQQRKIVQEGYVGEFKAGLRHGQGKFTYKGGSRYSGAWRNGSPDGTGELIYTNGDRYFGGWRNGKKHGQGALVFADGERYVGAWQDGTQHGHGEYNFANRDRYVGDWRLGKKTGRGELIDADGTRYVGDWLNDKRCGRGELFCVDGGRYVGGWQNDQKNGPGECFFADGERYVGTWRNDKFDGGNRYDAKGKKKKLWQK